LPAVPGHDASLPVVAELLPSQAVGRAAVLTVLPPSVIPLFSGLADAVAALGGMRHCHRTPPGLTAVEAIDALPDRHAGRSARVHRSRLDDAAAPALRRRLAKGLEISDAALAESIAARRAAHDFEQQVLQEAILRCCR
jgi:hypothetical protein